MTRISRITKAFGASAMAIAIACVLPVTAAHAQEGTASESSQTAAAHPWGINAADMQADPAIRYGVLANGMKYAIRKNETPKGGGVVRFLIDAGSAAEADNERGVAHFLEHMAFNGSKNIPEGELVKKLERLGLAFGADTNASTNLDQTVYMLDLPKTDAETLDAALLIMRETASELTISPEAVDRERGVVLSEKQTRNTPGLRQIENLLQTALPKTKLGFRMPVGTEEVLKTVSADTIKSFYRRFYRPENATMIMVGDFDVDAAEAKIEAGFTDWKAVGPAGVIDLGSVDTQPPLGLHQFNDPSATTIAQFSHVAPYQPPSNSYSGFVKSLSESMAMQIIGQRLDKIGRLPEAKVAGGFQLQEDLFLAARRNVLAMVAKGDDWQNAVAATEQELRRALQFGFTQSEVDEAIANTETALTNSVAQQGSRTSGLLADALIDSASKRRLVITPAHALELFGRAKAEINPESLSDSFRGIWAQGPTAIHVATKAPIADFNAVAVATLSDSAKIAVAPPEEAKPIQFAYDDFGKPGKVKLDKQVADLGIRTIRFENGVMLNIKKTDFEPGKILFSLRVGNGLAGLDQAPPGLSVLINIMSQYDGLGAHSYDDLQKLMAGKTVSSGLNLTPDGIGRDGATTAQDLELQMKLLAAAISSPGFRPETDAQWQAFSAAIPTQLEATPATVAQVKIPSILASGDSRIGIADTADIPKRSMAEAKDVLGPMLASAPVEIALIGDVDEQAAIEAVAKSFGALPKRAAKIAPVKPVTFPADRKTRILVHQGQDDQGMVSANWPTTDQSDLKSDIGRDLLAQILDSELRDLVREKMGATYSPSVLSNASSAFKGYGYISASIIAEPEKMDQISAAVREIAKALRDAPVTDDVLLRARQPMAERYEQSLRQNGSWLGIVGYAQGDPNRLDRRRQRTAVLNALTAADLQALARQYLTDEALLEVRVVSKAVAEAQSN
jgi:zinc protease